jgi:hypothetical protein
MKGVKPSMPHKGESRVRLVAYLPLIISDDFGIRAGVEERQKT